MGEEADNINFPVNVSGGSVEPNVVRPCARTGHVAVAKGNFMLVWGGYQMEDYNTRFIPGDEIWIYHADLGKWYLQLTQGEIPLGLSGACLIPADGMLYLFGGHCGLRHTNDLYKLDINNWTWTEVVCRGSKPSPRDKFSAWEFDRRLYIFGGYGDSFDGHPHECGDFVLNSDNEYSIKGWNNQVLMFDLEELQWNEVKCQGYPPTPRAAHTTVCMGNKAYMFGGRHDSARLNDIHYLNMETLTWSGRLYIEGAMPEGRSWHSWTAVSSTHIFLYGGFNQNNEPLSDAWVFDIEGLEWTQLDFPMNRPLLWHTSCCTDDGDILVFAGCRNNILSTEETSVYCNDVLVFRYSPKSLLRQCLETVVRHQDVLKSEWKSLPQELNFALHRRSSPLALNTSSSIMRNNRSVTSALPSPSTHMCSVS